MSNTSDILSWCHVMEHESFENESVAQIMNEHFINIKGNNIISMKAF